MRKTLFLIWCFFSVLCAFAQNNRSVAGKVTDSVGTPVARASIKLYFTGSPDTLRTFSSNDGTFSFSTVRLSTFFISISSIGYQKFDRRFSFDPSLQQLKLQNILLGNDVKTLQEVVIGIPPIQVKEDTVEYKADSFKVKPNSVVEDLLKKLPGVSVDKNGDVTAQGKKVTKVKVNGKDFFGSDPKTATRELPADIIDKIQIVDDYGDQAAISGIKDGEPEKVINLQLKKDKNKGVFGRATAGYGTEDRYQAALSANFFDNNRQLSVFGNSNNTNSSLFNFGGQSGGGGGGEEMEAWARNWSGGFIPVWQRRGNHCTQQRRYELYAGK